MLRSNSSVGGKLLLIFITFLLTIALIVGAVFIVYKKVQVRSIANILGADSLISESYDGTIEDFVKLLSDTLSDGSVALDRHLPLCGRCGERRARRRGRHGAGRL